MLMVERQLVVVSVMTTGYDPARHAVVEVAARNMVTGKRWEIVAPLSRSQMEAADPECLRLGEFGARGLGERGLRDADVFRDRVADLADGLARNTFAGSYPEFDAAFLMNLFGRLGLDVGWHRRMADIGSLTAGAFGLPATTIPDLGLCARLWGVHSEPEGSASALGQVKVTSACFAEYERYNAGSVAVPLGAPSGVVIPFRGRG